MVGLFFVVLLLLALVKIQIDVSVHGVVLKAKASILVPMHTLTHTAASPHISRITSYIESRWTKANL